MVCGLALLTVGLFLGSADRGAAAQPPNDDFSTAIQIPSGLQMIVGTTDDATVEPGEPDFPGGELVGTSVWYTYVAPRTGLLTLLMFDGSDFGIDVFRGASFSPRNRIGSAVSESNFAFPPLHRLTVSTRAGERLRIRIARLGNAIDGRFGVFLLQNGTSGNVSAVTVPATSGFAFSPRPGFVDQDYVRPSNLYAVVNTTAKSASLQVESSHEGLSASTTGSLVPARARTKPGLQLFNAERAEGVAVPVGTTDAALTAVTRQGSKQRRTSFPIFLQSYRSDRAEIAVTIPLTNLQVQMGRSKTFRATVRNTSAVDAVGCRLSQVGNSYTPTTTVRWRAINRPYEQSFFVRSGGKVTVEISLKPHFVGPVENWPDYAVWFTCDNAPLERVGDRVFLTGLIP